MRMVTRFKRQYVQGANREAMRLARSLPAAKQTKFPGFIEPSLATLAPPAARGAMGDEVKYDGYRFQCYVERRVRFFTRRGNDWSERLSHIVNAMGSFTDRSMILDGEVIVQTPEGRSDLHALEQELQFKGGSQRRVFYAFDILYFGGYDLRDAPLLERKRVLQELLKDIDGPIRYSEHLEGEGPTIWKRACELDLEGIVSKRADARYVSDRNPY